MSKSAEIRELGVQGDLSVSEIAEQVGVSYQFAYNVLRKACLLDVVSKGKLKQPRLQPTTKPSLNAKTLLDAGFVRVGCWSLCETGIALDKPPPGEPGIYVVMSGGVAQYVGVATISLAKRMYQYTNPGIGQKTNIRLNGLLREGLAVFRLAKVTPISGISASKNDPLSLRL